MDGFGPIGPRIVTADCLDPADLRIQSRVNDETRQDSTTACMIFSCARIVSYISSQMTLEPGDVIFTGTPPAWLSEVLPGQSDGSGQETVWRWRSRALAF